VLEKGSNLERRKASNLGLWKELQMEQGLEQQTAPQKGRDLEQRKGKQWGRRRASQKGQNLVRQKEKRKVPQME
jgi:hypothetical protein